VRGIKRRSLRLEWVAGLGIALAMAVLPAAAATGNIGSVTTLSATTSDRTGHTLATVTVNVTGADGLPAAGAVNIEDGTRTLAEVALSAAGQATATVGLPGGAHTLRAVYTGDATHEASSSPVTELQGSSSATPSFQVTVSPVSPSSFPMTLAQGASGTAEVTITPEDNAGLTAPMFVTLSCSGLPDQSSCTFTPETVEILATTPASCAANSPAANCPPVSSMLLQTQGPGTVAKAAPIRKASPIAWAFLLPGVLGLGGLAWGARRRAWLSRLALVALLGVVTTLGASGCAPLYRYYQHGPGNNPPTPAGSYTVTVTGQSSDGVTAITSPPTTFVLTVK
jgi:Bacterial Ig-like domain (group 3)